MSCRICGSEKVEYRNRSGMFLCGFCHKDTPAKVDRETFDAIYWEGQAETVPHSTRKEFYEDYLCSKYGSVKEYAARTTTCVD